MEKIKQSKWQEMKDSARMKWESFSMDMQVWWRDNKDWAVVVIPAGLVVATKLINAGTRLANSAIQANAAKHSAQVMWDPSMRMWHELRHPVSSVEADNIERLRAQGYTLNETLNILNLKK